MGAHFSKSIWHTVQVVVVVVVFYYCDMGEDCYNCYIIKTGSQLTPRAIVGL